MSVLKDVEDLVAAGRAAIAEAADAEALERARAEFLGRTGRVREMMGRIREVARDEKKTFGQKMNEAKTTLTELLEERKAAMGGGGASGPLPDPTLPGRHQPVGSLHPLTQTTEAFIAIFERLGFTVADGPEIEDDFHNFDALNIPADHPSREDQDTFALSIDEVLRSQTSTVQIRVMESQPPPVRIVAPGRVYRPDTVDATHFYAFSQIEGLAVDEGITFADLKGTLDIFAKELFGGHTQTRFRPSFFPFTEPSAEMDISCIFCEGSGCRVCKNSGWVEIGGCGMVDPNVFEAVNERRGSRDYDPDRVSGFAFGFGIERMAMFSLGVDDIRRFTENDLRFLRQF